MIILKEHHLMLLFYTNFEDIQSYVTTSSSMSVNVQMEYLSFNLITVPAISVLVIYLYLKKYIMWFFNGTTNHIVIIHVFNSMDMQLIVHIYIV